MDRFIKHLKFVAQFFGTDKVQVDLYGLLDTPDKPVALFGRDYVPPS